MPGRMVILRPRGKDEVGKCDGEYRQAEEESVHDPLHLFFVSRLRRRRHPSANECSTRLVCFHVAGSFLAVLFPAARLSDLPCGHEQPVRPSDNAVVKRREECPTGHCSAERFATAQ